MKPRANAREHPRRDTPSKPAPAREAPATTILIADDDDLFRRVLKEELLARGYQVLEARDGAQTLEQLALAADGGCASPDVVVLDVCMPGYSGLGVLSAMRRFAAPPPTLLVTGFRDPSVELFARRMGAHRILQKPIDLDEVLAAVLEAARLGASRALGTSDDGF